jgi:hypothetical protein
VIESDRVIELAYQRLSGDSTLSSLVGGRIDREPAMPVATGQPRYPFLTLGAQAATPVNTLSGVRVQQNVVLRTSIWATMASGQGWAILRQIGDRIDTLLQGYGGTASSVYVVKFRLIDVTDLVEESNGEHVLHRILLHRTEAHAA